jgi:hypothetical protein
VALDSIAREGKARSEHVIRCDSRVRSALSDLIRTGQCAIEVLLSTSQEGATLELGAQDMGTCKLLVRTSQFSSLVLPQRAAVLSTSCSSHCAEASIGNQLESSDVVAGDRRCPLRHLEARGTWEPRSRSVHYPAAAAHVVSEYLKGSYPAAHVVSEYLKGSYPALHVVSEYLKGSYPAAHVVSEYLKGSYPAAHVVSESSLLLSTLLGGPTRHLLS